MAFAKAVENSIDKQSNETVTWNGAKSLKSSTNGRVDLFYGALRQTAETKLIELLKNSWKEDPLHTLRILAYIRDCRGGKGERQLGRWGIKWLMEFHEEYLRLNLNSFLKLFGRYDDGLVLMNTPMEKEVITLYKECLMEDLIALKENHTVSLCAKWIPSENKKMDKQTKFISKLCKEMSISSSQLRKQYLSPLRKKLCLLERYMCANEWDAIDFNKVPSMAMLRHGKPNHAFPRRLEEKFGKWKEDLAEGKSKVNAKVLFPHQVVEQYYKHQTDDKVSELVEAQWKVMIEKAHEMGDLSHTLVMSDVSGSMTGTPMLISLTLGLLISQVCQDEFRNLVLTFEEIPRFHKVKGENLFERVNSLNEAPWGGSTNFIAGLELILDVAKKEKLKESDMPSRLIVVSDMQFNQAHGNYETNYQVLVKKYKKAGYKVPHLVFWNVNGSISDFPVGSKETNVSMVSGFSVDILKSVLKGEEITPFGTMMNAIMDERYDIIRIPTNSEDEAIVMI